MHEDQILNILDSLTLNSLSYDEKAIIVADIKFETSNKRFSNNMTKIVLQKVNDLKSGLYKESQIRPDIFQDFSESVKSKPFEISNQDDIDLFLEKMSSSDFENSYFDDTWSFYHPTEVMKADGVPRHRSDFNVK